MVVFFYVQICCSVEGLFSCRRILTQRGTFSQQGPGSLFLPGDFRNFDSFLKSGLSMRGTDLRRLSASPLMKHFFTPGGCHEYVKGFCMLAHGPQGWFMCLHVQDLFLVESNPFVHFCVQESDLCFLHLSREFDSICLFHNFSSLFCLGSIAFFVAASPLVTSAFGHRSVGLQRHRSIPPHPRKILW